MAHSGHPHANLSQIKVLEAVLRFSNHVAPDRLGRKKISNLKVNLMAWTTPAFEEIVLNCEINSYASAQL
jgi:coenzyme PQQ precursor peptide PqqA